MVRGGPGARGGRPVYVAAQLDGHQPGAVADPKDLQLRLIGAVRAESAGRRPKLAADRMMPLALWSIMACNGVSNGSSSQSILGAADAAAISWANWLPKSRTNDAVRDLGADEDGRSVARRGPARRRRGRPPGRSTSASSGAKTRRPRSRARRRWSCRAPSTRVRPPRSIDLLVRPGRAAGLAPVYRAKAGPAPHSRLRIASAAIVK